MRFFSILLALGATSVLAQNCGPKYGNQICAAGTCCSQYGWCDTGAAYCDPKTCLKQFSGKGSSCASGTTPTPTKAPASPYESTVPEIDVCGAKSNGISCPGAGPGAAKGLGYYYRCCSSAGHCGPKNNIQDQNIYCGTGCQKGFGKCDNEAKPADPAGSPGIAQAGDQCGPIVNKKCASGLCCSGSNFCGSGTDFCGAANWCQPKWGKCN